MIKQKLVIIVINYGTVDFIKDLVRNFLGSLPRNPKLRIDWIIADTQDKYVADQIAENDDNKRFFKDRRSNRFHIYKIPNRGFATNVNGAFLQYINENKELSWNENDLVFLLNPDINLYWPSLERAVDFMNKSQDTSVSGLALTNPKGQLEKWGHSMTFPSLKLFFGHKRFSQPSLADAPVQVAWTSGGAMLIKYGWWQKLGGLDSNFFMYFEDVDFCKRIENAGGKIYFLPEATVSHLRGGSNISIYRRKKHFYSAEARYFFLYRPATEYLLLRIMRFPYKIFYFLRCYLAPSYWKNIFTSARTSLSCERESGFPRYCAFKNSFLSIPYLKEIWLATLLFNFVVLGCAIWAKFYLFTPLILHYNAYLGIDLYGDTFSFFMFPIMALLVSIFNFVLGIVLFFSKRYTPFVILPAGASLAFQIGLIIGVINLLIVNN